MIKVIIFDYDGVIVDSFSNIYDIYKTMGNELEVEIPNTITEFRKVYGYDFHECYENLGMCSDKQKKALETFKREIITKSANVFSGIKDVLNWSYNHYTVILVSSNYNEEVTQKLRSHNIDKYFSVVIGHKDGYNELDKSEEFKKILNKYNIKGNEVIVIGDRLSDYHSGKKAGIENVILVEYGWGYDKSKFTNNKFVVNKPRQLINAIKKIDSSHKSKYNIV